MARCKQIFSNQILSSFNFHINTRNSFGFLVAEKNFLLLLFSKNGPFPASFSLFSSFQYNWRSVNNFSNRGPLVSEATAWPTEPQPLLKECFLGDEFGGICDLIRFLFSTVQSPRWGWIECLRKNILGSGCDSVGRAVASGIRGPWFESSHAEFFFLLNTKIKRKRVRKWPILKINTILLTSCVTSVGDLLEFGQLFKAFGNN